MEFASIYYYGKDHWPVALIDKETGEADTRGLHWIRPIPKQRD